MDDGAACTVISLTRLIIGEEYHEVLQKLHRPPFEWDANLSGLRTQTNMSVIKFYSRSGKFRKREKWDEGYLEVIPGILLASDQTELLYSLEDK